MTAGSVIVLAFWVIFTVRKHFTPKLAAAEKANTYDLNRDNPEAKRAAQRRRGPRRRNCGTLRGCCRSRRTPTRTFVKQ